MVNWSHGDTAIILQYTDCQRPITNLSTSQLIVKTLFEVRKGTWNPRSSLMLGICQTSLPQHDTHRLCGTNLWSNTPSVCVASQINTHTHRHPLSRGVAIESGYRGNHGHWIRGQLPFGGKSPWKTCFCELWYSLYQAERSHFSWKTGTWFIYLLK